MSTSHRWQRIPTILKEKKFNEFVLPYLTKGSRGPDTKLAFYIIFNYILKLMHTEGAKKKHVKMGLKAIE